MAESSRCAMSHEKESPTIVRQLAHWNTIAGGNAAELSRDRVPSSPAEAVLSIALGIVRSDRARADATLGARPRLRRGSGSCAVDVCDPVAGAICIPDGADYGCTAVGVSAARDAGDVANA